MSLDHLAGAEQDLKQNCEKVHMCIDLVAFEEKAKGNWEVLES